MNIVFGWHPVAVEETFYSFVNGSRATPSKVTDWTSDYWFSSQRRHNREASSASHQPITFGEASTLWFDSAWPRRPQFFDESQNWTKNEPTNLESKLTALRAVDGWRRDSCFFCHRMVCHFAAPGLVLLSRTLPQFTCCKVNDKERATAVTSDKVKFICISSWWFSFISSNRRMCWAFGRDGPSLTRHREANKGRSFPDNNNCRPQSEIRASSSNGRRCHRPADAGHNQVKSRLATQLKWKATWALVNRSSAKVKGITRN